MQFTNTFYKNAAAKKRYVFNQGGAWSGKTRSILQKENIISMKYPNLVTSCMSESVPHLRMGMIRDFKEMLITEGTFNPNNWNKTESIYSYPNGSIIEFFSADNPSKVHGGRRNRLVGNEVNNIPYEIFYQAASRTKDQIVCDYNPTSVFWAHDKYINNPAYKDQVDYIHSTYLDNPFTPEAVIKDMLSRAKNDENYRRVYIEGQTGTVEGLVFPDFNLVDEMPEEYKLRVDGQDYGFTNDPTTHIDCRLAGGQLWFDELIYEKGLVNLDNSSDASIEKRMKSLGIDKTQKIIGDSAEPKTIRDLRNAGYNIKGALKGKDSIIYGIKGIKQYPINVTKRSLNIIEELRSYKWKFDKNLDRYIDTPEDKWNHCIDAMRYAIQEMFGGFNTNMQVRL